MAKHVWSVLCYKCSIDRSTNSVSLLEVLEALQVGADPSDERALVAQRCELASLWRRTEWETPEKSFSRVRVLAPDSTLIATAQSEVDLVSATRSRLVVQLSAFPLMGPGIYEFLVDGSSDGTSWEEVARVPVEVTFNPTLQAEGAKSTR